MRVQAVFVDFGGVIMRTEDKGPRTRLAKKLGMTVHNLEKLFFESDSSHQASTGKIPEETHWESVAQVLGVGRTEAGKIIDEFFSGDQADSILLGFMRGLRPERKVGLISNAWSGLRSFIANQDFDDVFDEMVISAEVGVMKPDARIYHLALKKLGVCPEESVFFG